MVALRITADAERAIGDCRAAQPVRGLRELASALVGLHAARHSGPYVTAYGRLGPAADREHSVVPARGGLVDLRCMRGTLHAMPVDLGEPGACSDMRFAGAGEPRAARPPRLFEAEPSSGCARTARTADGSSAPRHGSRDRCSDQRSQNAAAPRESGSRRLRRERKRKPKGACVRGSRGLESWRPPAEAVASHG